MRIRTGVTAALILLIVLPAAAAPRAKVLAPRFNVLGTTVEIVFTNVSDEPVLMAGTWRIGRARTDQTMATYRWAEGERMVAPGASRRWAWDQREGCTGECSKTSVGEQVEPGPYVVAIGGRRRAFQVGQFFQIGFDHLPEDETLTVFVNRSDDIAEMTSEADAQDKTLIVSGIVRKGRDYNRPWTITMGPGSIVLGEVFVEVCDADPYQVQDYRRSWLGERWCPWSSYVAAVGR